MNTPTKIICHHAWSGTNYTVEMCDNDHKARWPGFISRRGYHVGYHWFIEFDGTATQTRDYDEEGAHCIGANRSSIGVCFAGNFDVHKPSRAQIDAWRDVYADIVANYPDIGVEDIYPHRKYATKSCHGKLLDDHYFKSFIGQDRTKMKQQLEAIKQQLIQLFSLLTNRRV